MSKLNIKKYSRAQKLCDIACGSVRNDDNVCDVILENEEDHSISNNSTENRLLDSPLPGGADLIEISALSELLGDDFVGTPSTLTTLTVCDNDEELLEIITSSSNRQQLKETSEKNDTAINNNVTPHPTSPSCSINHLDVDCTNDFCPYFIGANTIHEPLSVLSDFSGYSTPQANTPMSSYSVDSNTPVTRRTKARKDKGNIRRRHEQEWIDTKRKTLKNLGKAYLNRKGITQPKKNMKAPCNCRMKCYDKISNDHRKKIFKAFWKIGDHQKQWMYISNLVSQNIKRRVYTDKESRRKYTIQYKLPLPAFENHTDAQYVNVCKKQFLATFAISEQFVYTAINKINSSTGTIENDNRGKHGNQPRKITDDVKKSVIDHINCLQPVEAHYVRKDSSKLYLDGDLNFRRLFAMYNEWFDHSIYPSKAETKRQYKTCVNENFKLSFFKPKKDQCDICHKYTLINPTNEQREAHEIHISNKNIARVLKTADKKEAISSEGKIIAATFDFQKVLNSPCGEISVFYYKRKLGTMNFTVFDLANKLATCYMWHEGEGKRGANEVASCLADFIANGVQNGAVEFRFWSDNCTGQNRNRIVFAAYMFLAEKYKITIKHTFLEKGHTQQEGDSVHALIERNSKNKLIYTPFEWFTLVRWAKTDGKPYKVTEMNHTNFLDFKSKLQGKNWKKNLQGNTVQWTKIKELKVLAGQPNKLLYKYDLNEQEYMTIVTKVNTRRRQQNISVNPLYDSSLPISQAKKNDLISLCISGVIPTIHHNFYNGLLEEPSSSRNMYETDSE